MPSAEPSSGPTTRAFFLQQQISAGSDTLSDFGFVTIQFPSDSPTVMPTLKPSGSPTISPTLKPSSYPTVKPSSRPTARTPTTTPFAAPSVTPHFNPSEVPSMTPTIELTTISQWIGYNVDLCDISYEEVYQQELNLMNSFNANPQILGLNWVANVTITNDKFDFAPYNPDNTGTCVSPTHFGRSVIKAFSIPDRPSEAPSMSSNPSISSAPSVAPTLSDVPTLTPTDAPTVVKSVAPSITASTFPSVYPSSNPVESPSYAPTSVSEMPSNGPTPKQVFYYDFGRV